VYVRSFNGSGRLTDLPLSQHRTSLGAERDATSAATLKVYHSQTQVVCIGSDLYLNIDSAVVPGCQEVCSQPAAAIGNLVRALHYFDLVTVEGCAERGCLGVEELVPAFPVLAATLTSCLETSVALERKKATTTYIQLHAIEGCITNALPRPKRLGIELTQQLVGDIYSTEVSSFQPRGHYKVRPVC
jgi:hypothetical protein